MAEPIDKPHSAPEHAPSAEKDTASLEAQARKLARNEEYKHSLALLEEARSKAAPAYSSVAARKTMTEVCKARSQGRVTPHAWQLDVAECLILGIDTELIAATGAGKTLPFVLPLFYNPKRTIVIERRFTEFGLTAKAINGNTWKEKSVRRKLKKGMYQIVITSPEMCLLQPEFREVLDNPRKKRKIAAFIIDEAHCIVQWGDKFRVSYSSLGTLRAFVPGRVPFLVTSATLTPHDLHDIRKSVHMQRHASYHLNLGNDRPNIEWSVHHMKAGKSDTGALFFLVPDETGPEAELQRGVVFFDDIGVSMEALRDFREQLPEHLRERVACYHAQRGPDTKKHIMDHFNRGDIDIIFATEAAGMGCDMTRVSFVVQFMVPRSLSAWLQRAGRAGRDAFSQAYAVLLVQPTVFQEKGKKKRLPDEKILYVKEIEDGLRQWIESEQCRRNVADIYFNNPIERKDPTGKCCDICTRLAAAAQDKTTADEPMLPASSRADTTAAASNLSPVTHSTSSEAQNANGKRAMCEPEHEPDAAGLGPLKHRAQQLADRRAALETWRSRTYNDIYIERTYVFGLEGLMPDTVITVFATNGRWQSIDDVKHAPEGKMASMWWGLKKHGEEVFEVLRSVDLQHRQLKKRKADEEEAARVEKTRLALEAKQEKERLRLQDEAQRAIDKEARDAAKAAEKAADKVARTAEKARLKAEREAAKAVVKAAEKVAKTAEKERLRAEKEAADEVVRIAAKVERERVRVEKKARKEEEKAVEDAKKAADKASKKADKLAADEQEKADKAAAAARRKEGTARRKKDLARDKADNARKLKASIVGGSGGGSGGKSKASSGLKGQAGAELVPRSSLENPPSHSTGSHSHADTSTPGALLASASSTSTPPEVQARPRRSTAWPTVAPRPVRKPRAQLSVDSAVVSSPFSSPSTVAGFTPLAVIDAAAESGASSSSRSLSTLPHLLSRQPPSPSNTDLDPDPEAMLL
ncbi:P-loop containing nucleoside triphosphate hydrolase protein [Peniophora sp. CONT]|nr:P-loop containing nucleoside triphosphate hydrolase protein [Peniophora sp. CONT]